MNERCANRKDKCRPLGGKRPTVRLTALGWSL